MNKQKKLFYYAILMLLDIAVILVSLYICVKIRSDYWPVKEAMKVNKYLYYNIVYLLVPTYVVCYMVFNLYRMESEKYFYIDAGKIAAANIVGAAILTILSFFFKRGWEYSRFVLVMFVILNTFLSIVGRKILRYIVHRQYNKFIYKKNILIVGAGRLGQAYYTRIMRYADWGNNVVGFLSNKEDINYFEDQIKEIKILGKIDEIEKVVQNIHIDEVIIALPSEEYKLLAKIISFCDKEGIRTKILPGYFEHLQISTKVEELDGMPILNVREVPLDSLINRYIKRVFDIVISLIGIVLTSPIMLFAAIGVKLSSPGPVLFKQERVGINNKTFNMLKFRSMVVQNDEEEKVQWTTKDDPRKTKFGAFIRKTSIDELPQLFNVLKGDMSIVGPRPERPYWVNKYKEEIPDYMLRHYIKSGITGWAQINGLRGDTSIEERIKYDNYYIHNWSFWLDIKIIIMTFIKGFINQNAY